MRDIKFRAWDIGRNTMIGSDYSKNWGNNSDEWYFDLACMQLTGIEDISKDPYYIVMQYTGLKDKNCKEIYEGDIVRLYEWEHGFEYTDRKVVFFQGCFKVEDMNDGYFCNIDLVNLSLCKVVGNIYENPELLEGKK